ncbi:MAG: 50S ribosomal protein L25 [Candidatus Nomurabacteria bacterium]|jgi:large subunit ribosomal protein L25|nr:50S ribosomal protein L25 [Candidatus Nomurabacteria bacterium]
MSDKVTLIVEKREATGKKVAKLRQDGLVPAVIYGSDYTPHNVQLTQQDAQRVIREAGRHMPVELTLDGKTNTALVKSIDRAPARHDITHISFQRVRADEIVTTEIPLVLIGESESAAAKAGLIILPTMEEIEIRAKVSELPDKIEVDASGLTEHGDKLLMSDVEIPSGVEVMDYDPELVIASVWEPAALEAKNAAADKAADEERAKEAEAGAESSDENVPSGQEEKATEESTETKE